MAEFLIPLKAKYRQPGRVMHRAGLDPAEGTKVFLSAGGAYVSRDVSNGPNRVKKYKKRANKKRPRRRTYPV